MTPTERQWPEDPFERIEAKLDAYREEHRMTIHGDPKDPTKPGLDGRLRAVEKDVSSFKAGGVAAATIGIPMLLDWIRRKTGL